MDGLEHKKNTKGFTVYDWLNLLHDEVAKADLIEFYKKDENKGKDWGFDWQISRDPKDALLRDMEYHMNKIRLTCPIMKSKIKK